MVEVSKNRGIEFSSDNYKMTVLPVNAKLCKHIIYTRLFILKGPSKGKLYF